MKTQRLIKENKDYKFYNGLTGIFQWSKVFFNIFRGLLLSLIYKFGCLFFWGFQVDIINFHHSIFKYFYTLKDIYSQLFEVNIFAEDMQIFFVPDILLLYYIVIATIMYYRSKKVLQLSNLGLENYSLKKQNNYYYLKLKHGEEIEFDYVLSIKDDIKQILKIKDEKSISILRSNTRDIKINILPDLLQYNISLEMLKDGYVYFGQAREYGNIYKPLSNLTHYLIAGASGSGKSVFQNLLITSFLHNIATLQDLFLVDLKGGKVEFGRYQDFASNVTVIGNLSSFFKLTKELINIMESRYKFMRLDKITELKNNTIIVMIDEYSTIETQLHELTKEDAKELKNNLKTLLAKARAANIKFIIATQKGTSDSIDTTLRENLQSKILMRTKSKDAQKAVLNDLEILDELDVKPSKFLKGQYIFIDDDSGNDYLIQSPYISDNFYLSLKNNNSKDKKLLKIQKDIGEVNNFEIKNILTLEIQISIRKNLYVKCKCIKSDEIRKKYFNTLRMIKYEYHDKDKKYEDISFNNLLNEVKTEIKKWEQTTGSGEAEHLFDNSVMNSREATT